MRRVMLVILALLISGGAVFLTQMLLRGPRGHGGKGNQVVASEAPAAQVLVVRSDLYAGQFVKPTDLAWQAWPSADVPADYAVEGRSRLGDYVGAVATARMSPGDPVTPAHLVRPGERGFMAAVLAPGDRAVTVNVTPSTGMAGFLYPGDRVDILLTQTIQSSGAGSARHVSETILHGVKVVGLDQTLSDKKDDAKGLGVPKTATLEVTPKQAEIVAVATDIGVLTLALDSVADPSRQGAPQAVTKTWDTEATQIAVAAPASSAPRAAGRSPAPPVWTVDVVRGGASASAPFPMAAVGRPVIGS